MRYRNCVFSALFVLSLLKLCATAFGSDVGRLRILTPRDGAVKPSHQLVVIRAKFNPPVHIDKAGVNATITAFGENRRYEIGRGDLRSLQRVDTIEGIWNIHDVPAGRYTITVTAESEQIRAEGTTTITVHRSPNALIKVQEIHEQAEGVSVTVRAEIRSPENTPVSDFLWTPGDGSLSERTNRPSLTHLYRPGNTYKIWLQATDDQQGVALVARLLDLTKIPLLKKQPQQRYKQGHPEGEEISDSKCGCKSMKIVDTGTTKYCIDEKIDIASAMPLCKAVPDPAPAAPGSGGSKPAKICSKGKQLIECSIEQKLPDASEESTARAFDIQVELTEETNDPSKCSEGQYVKGLFKIDGLERGNPAAKPAPPGGDVTLSPDNKKIHAVVGPKKVPKPGSPDWGADNFTEESDDLLKEHSANRIHWWDLPSVGQEDAEKLSLEDEFIAFIKGNPNADDSCWCQFTVTASWKHGKNGAADTHDSKVKKIDGKNCTGP